VSTQHNEQNYPSPPPPPPPPLTLQDKSQELTKTQVAYLPEVFFKVRCGQIAVLGVLLYVRLHPFGLLELHHGVNFGHLEAQSQVKLEQTVVNLVVCLAFEVTN
jgi:hypothetical protein